MTLITNRDFAVKNMLTHAFLPEVGYTNVGIPRLNFPAIHPPAFCEPPAGTADKTLHMLKAPQSPADNAVGEAMTWHADQKQWEPMLGRGTRLAYASAYLASHGWEYAGPVEIGG